MIYILVYAKLMPGTPSGCISDLFEDAFLDMKTAEKAFKNLILTNEYFRKELWVKENNGRRKCLKEERFNGVV